MFGGNFLGTFAKLRNSLLGSSRLSVYPSVRPQAPRGWIFGNFMFIFGKSAVEIQVSSKSDKNKGYFM